MLRRVEEGEELRVTRQGVPVALLTPVPEDGGLRCAKPAFHGLRPNTLRRLQTDAPSEALLAALRCGAACLVTYDQRLADAARNLGLSVLTPVARA